MIRAAVSLAILLAATAASAQVAEGDPQTEGIATARPTQSVQPFVVLRRIMIDPGHGGTDSGCVGVSGVAEKELTLKTSRRLARALESRVEWVGLTRDGDEYPTLEERTLAANLAESDALVSVHYNCAANPAAVGIETFFLDPAGTTPGDEVPGREELGPTRVVVEYGVGDELPRLIFEDLRRLGATWLSARLADAVQAALIEHTGAYDRGVRQASFRVLRGAHMPAIVAELGFLTNEEEGLEVLDGARMEAVVAGLLEGLAAYDEAASSWPDANPHIED